MLRIGEGTPFGNKWDKPLRLDQADPPPPTTVFVLGSSKARRSAPLDPPQGSLSMPLLSVMTWVLGLHDNNNEPLGKLSVQAFA